MKFNRAYTIQEIAELLNAPFEGNDTLIVTGINEIHKIEPGEIVFVDHPKYYKKALNSAADLILIDQRVDEIPPGKGIIICEAPFDAFNQLTKHFSPTKVWTGAHGDNFSLGENTAIYPNVIIGHNVSIGNNCMIHAGVVIGDHTVIKDGVTIGPNSVIGHYAFYYKKKEGIYDRMHTCGRTIIEDNVEIGALSTIDRGVTGDTIIGKGTKIDNQVHVGHDTVIGENCLFAANVGIAGCVVIKNNVTLWGQVGVVSDITINDNVTVLGQSGVGGDLEEGKTYFGSPCGEARSKFKELAAFKRLPSIIENL
ncbi:UDP-3-O-(3-hydroxymyristoyl)glucosamine N-acyltransferase [Crocinitomix algicola]|uniref:UDP-3-O-(3-hydroxymyristoyl)glucosamine N-acyltransferase n=1 Tax=Crocinitomix algicola TaxID=1740263 RepID=UPI000833FF24|nr:LpxD N-terminal domain-containing protein [Crocinitomix algicola]